jgi:hypothetical protein
MIWPLLVTKQRALRLPSERKRISASVINSLQRQEPGLNFAKQEQWTEQQVKDLPAGEHDYFERKSGLLLDKPSASTPVLKVTPWRRRTNVWREVTSPGTGPMRLRSGKARSALMPHHIEPVVDAAQPRTMKNLLTIAALVGALCTPAIAQNQTTFRDSRGSTIGTATRSGNTVTFRNSRGSTTGTATTLGNQTTYRNSRGSTTGTSTGAGR